MTQLCTAQQCMTVWSLECDLAMVTITLMLTQITQSTSSAAQQPSSLCTDVASVDSTQLQSAQAVPGTQQHTGS